MVPAGVQLTGRSCLEIQMVKFLVEGTFQIAAQIHDHEV